MPSSAAPLVVAAAKRLLGSHACLHKPFQFAGVLAEHGEYGVRSHGEPYARFVCAPRGLEISLDIVIQSRGYLLRCSRIVGDIRRNSGCDR